MIILGGLLLVGGFSIGFFGPYLFGSIISYFQNYRVIKEITPSSVDESKLCKGPHVWLKSRGLTMEGIKSINVCQVCGYIPSMNKMASPEAIDRIEENNKRRDMEDKIFRDFSKEEEEDIKKYFDSEIKGGVSFDKLAHIHTAGMTFSARLNTYKAARASEIEKVLSKSDA